ncbi:MAG: Nif3-like dinuclear metal center hexameric protein [Anaeromicrobium sp.]|jgi:dinuclear metal center YbgI/SA1388 family protein|uniref:Nif3-like dinuclear metal center hexameric protein n=1 Tax=Anaeromicrobium sp. TaxID=1929132 RepID=UPI0025EBF122|nr:Nif3-like dinuclear metal center hexameric protein [Anaeromicrobium sp.]MCT4594572.1 Nif3-like dinuclear metal center hexameric protein [Anaeromicrobium sp.]
MPRKLKKLIRNIEKIAPKKLAEKWDNVGLLVGDIESDINTVLVALEATSEVIDEAIDNNVDMIITHHPLIFNKLKAVVNDNPIGSMIHKLIKNNISVYAIHTNLDVAYGGTNDLLGELVGLENKNVLVPTMKEDYYKIIVYVPTSHKEKVMDSMCSQGAGHIGEYSHCTFQSIGKGTFKPSEEANPFIGESNKLEYVEETKLETIVSKNHLNKVINKMIESHPYEEVAYDIFKLENNILKYGLGRVGTIKESTLEEVCKNIKDKLAIESLKVVGNMDRKIEKVALCTGSGASFIENAHRLGCDLYITGDVKYHDAQNAKELGICVIDAGHFETENIVCDLVAEYLTKELNNNVKVLVSKLNINPFKTI